MKHQTNNMKTTMKMVIGLGLILVVAALSFGCAGQTISTVQNPDGTASTVTNYTPNATATQLGNGAQTAALIIGAAVPSPFGGAAALGIGLLGLITTTVAGAIAAGKKAQANLHQNTLQAVITGVENALPGIQQALTTTAASGVASANVNTSLNTANSVLSAVKASITSATFATGTHTNLNNNLAQAGVGPTAA